MADKEIIQLEVQTGASLRNLEAMRAGLVGLRGALDQLEARARGGSSELLAEFNRLKSATAGIETSLGRAAGGAKRWGNEINFASGKAKALPGSLREATEAFNALSVGLGRTSDRASGSAEAVKRMGGAYRAAGGHAQAFTEGQHAMHSAMRGVSGALGGLWLTYGKYIAVMVAATAATRAAQQSFVQGAELGYQAQFAAVLSNDGPAAPGQVERIRDQLIAVTDGTRFNALQAAEGIRVLAQTGIKAADGLGMMNTVMAATVFGETDMKTATEGITSALYNFGLQTTSSRQNAKNVAAIGDAMAFVSTQTKAGMNDVAESFKNMTGLAQRYGLTVEQAATVLEKLGKAGITGGLAGTRTRNMFEDLLGAPNNRTAAQIKENLGLGQFVQGRDDPLVYLQKVIDKYRELDATKRQQFDANVLNERGRVVFSLLAADAESLTDALGRTTEASDGLLERLSKGLEGNVKVAFTTAMSDLDNAFAQALTGSEDALLALGRTLGETFRSKGFRDGLRDMVSALSDLAKWMVNNTDTLKLMMGAYGTFKVLDILAKAKTGFIDLRGSLALASGEMGKGAGAVGRLSSSLRVLAELLSASSLVRVLSLLAAHPAVALTVSVVAAGAYIFNRETQSSPDSLRERSRTQIGLEKNTDIGMLEEGKAQAALDKAQERKKMFELLPEIALKNNIQYLATKKDIAELSGRLSANMGPSEDLMSPVAVPAPVIEEGSPFDTGGGGSGQSKAEKEAFKYIEQQKRLAEVGYQQAIDSVETYRKGLELRKGASMVGEKEYLTLQDELANLEIEHGLKREQAKQAAIKSQLGKVSGDGRERMLEMLKESLAEQSRLETKAIGERYLAQERAATELVKRTKTRSDAIMQIESASRNENLSEQEAYYGVQLDVQGRFLRDWMANEGKLMAGAVEDNDLPAQARLMKIFEAGNARATFKPDAASGYSEGMAGMDMVKSAEEAFRGTQEKLRAHLQISSEMYDVHFAKIDELYRTDAVTYDTALQMKEQLDRSFQQRMLELYVDSARERLELGTGGWEDMMLTSLDRVREGFTNFADGTATLMGDFFTSFTDGFANSVGRAIVYSEDLNEAMKNIAREALASLISGLIKLGIQWALTQFLQDRISQTSMITNAVASQAVAATTAAAWAPAAAAVSLATFGTNAAPAMSGMALTHLLSQSLSSFAGFKDKGGMIPTGQWGIAGENGPEIVQGPARVTSTRDTAKMLGGGGGKSLTIQQNFNVVVDGGGDGNKGEAQGAAIAQTMRREMKQAVIEVLVNEKRAGGVLA